MEATGKVGFIVNVKLQVFANSQTEAVACVEGRLHPMPVQQDPHSVYIEEIETKRGLDTRSMRRV